MATTLNLDIAQELDITVRKGDNFSFTVTVKDSNGDAVDISPGNYTFNIDVRTSTDRSSRDNVVLSSAGNPQVDIASLMTSKLDFLQVDRNSRRL